MSNLADSGSTFSRRGFLGSLLALGGALGAALLAIPLVRFALFPLRARGDEGNWCDLGPLDQIAPSGAIAAPHAMAVTLTTRDGWREAQTQQSVYVVPGGGTTPRVLTAVCPHLGCSVQWRPQHDRFICPCHGGTFLPDGTRVSGPPARGMDTLETRVQAGRLQVRFQFFRQLVAQKEALD